MKEFIDKLIERLEEAKNRAIRHYNYGNETAYLYSIEIVNELAGEYKVSETPTDSEGYCEWEYDEYEDGWQTDCGTCFTLHDDDKEITNFCPYCGKKIKVVPYTEGE